MKIDLIWEKVLKIVIIEILLYQISINKLLANKKEAFKIFLIPNITYYLNLKTLNQSTVTFIQFHNV